MNYYNNEELFAIGFASIGKNVLISKDAKFYNPQNIYLGNHIRIDDFCVLSAGSEIRIEDHVHLAVGCTLIGQGKIHLSKFCGLSSRVSVYSSNDDYSGHYLTGPTVDNQFRGVNIGHVFIGKHVIVGSGSIILPDVRLEEGVAVGALTVIRKNCRAFGIYSGNPAQLIKQRNQNILKLEQEFLSSNLEKIGNS